jgi:uncharacterized membrane protein
MKKDDSIEGGDQHPVETAVSLVLRVGVILSAAIIVFGLILLAAKNNRAAGMRIDAAIPYPRTLSAVLSGVLSLDPASVLVLGALALIATPFSRVAISIVAFAQRRDWLYVIITSVVMAILIAGITIAGGTG